jgi:hypothetical protein
LIICQTSKGQKKWDGEAMDNQWSNPLNWYPNGVPGNFDDVILDHTYLPDAFTVVLMDTITSSINSLQILSGTSAVIRLIIPPSNINSPALHLNTSGTALLIGSNTILQNRSGATAGNSITMNGSMIILNEGRYIHGTLRGNSVLISKLTATDVYPKGVFEFDVPGTSGYILSLSGRQFPVLQLSSTLAGKKSYSGSGNSHCTVKGDLIVSDSSSLNLSLNGNLLLSSALIVNGKFQWQPASTDSIGRELQFTGDSCLIQHKGSLKMGSNFRKLVVADGRLYLNAPIRLDFLSQGIEVKNRSTLILDTFYCSGPGWFKSDSLSTIFIGSSKGISDTSEGNIRLENLNFHPKTLFNFNSSYDQNTGIRFPSILSTMILNKPSGELKLSRSLVVTDSLALNSGKILSSQIALLEFKGKKIIAGIKSYINGPLKRTGNFIGEIIFPIGDDSTFAPTIIDVRNNVGDSHSYMITYKASAAPNSDSLRCYPVKNISKNEYWILESSASVGSSDSNVILRFPIGSHSLKDINGQPNFVYFDSLQMKWIMLPLMVNASFPNTISTNLPHWKNGLYTLGGLDPMALPNEKIYLQWKRFNNEVNLQWQVTGASRTDSLILEINDSNNFNIKSKLIVLPSAYRSFTLSSEKRNDIFAKIKALLENGEILTSNTIRIPRLGSEKSVFPNPSSSRLYLNTGQQSVWVILQDGRKMKAKVIYTGGNAYIDISNYPRGIHRVLSDQDANGKWQAFMKQ